MNRKSSKSARRFQCEQLESRVVLSNIFVSPTGKDTNAGTSAAPYLTLQQAANVVKPGDVVTVAAGTYKGFNLATSGTPTARITFQAQPGVTINQHNSWSNDDINLEGASNVTIKGFKVTGALRAGIRVTSASNDIVTGNIADQNAYWGIYASHVTNVVVDHNVASRSVKEHGIYIANSSANPSVTYNTIYNNHSCGIHMNGGLGWGDGNGLISGAVVQGNVIYGNGAAGGSAINLDGVVNSQISNNLLYNNTSSGISLFRGDGATGSTNNLVANNTIVVPAGARWAVNINSASTGNQLINNILLNADSYRGSVYVTADSMAGFKSDYNVGTVFSTDVNYYKTLAAWRAATGQDAHSFSSTPAALFVSPANNNYMPSSTSPAIDAGIVLSPAVATDVTGRVRPTTGKWSLGAYTYVPVAATAFVKR